MKTILIKAWIVIVVLCASLSAYAYDFEVDGIYYSVISTKDLTCAVTSGDVKYRGDIVIPSEVTYNNRQLSVIAIWWAFENCGALTSVTIPDSVTEIGSYAFKGCSSLTSVTIPDSVTEIGEHTFDGCSSLTSVTIPDSVTKIGKYAFEECSSMTSVTISGSITEIGEHTFDGCNSLTSVTIPDSVTKIGKYAFEGCSSLTSVTIPDSVTEIGAAAFHSCSSLTSVTIPDSVTEIGDSAFYGCSSLTSIKLSDSLKDIRYGLFGGCESLESLNIPGSVKHIYQFRSGWTESVTFNGCDNLKMLRIEYSPEVLEPLYIHSYTYYDWYYWTELIEVLYIDRDLKESIPVPYLEKLELGDSVHTVQIYNIKNLNNLITIESHALVPPKLPEMSNAQYMNVNVFVAEEALEAYQADENWGKFWNLQPSGVDGVNVDSKKEVIGRYDMNGRAVSDDYEGLVIVRLSDGSCKKMLNR